MYSRYLSVLGTSEDIFTVISVQEHKYLNGSSMTGEGWIQLLRFYQKS